MEILQTDDTRRLMTIYHGVDEELQGARACELGSSPGFDIKKK